MTDASPARLGRRAGWAVLVLGLLLAVAGLRLASRDLGGAVQAVLAASLHLPLDGVRIGAAHIHPLGEVRLSEVSVRLPQGLFQVAEVVAQADPDWSWPRPLRVRLRRVALSHLAFTAHGAVLTATGGRLELSSARPHLLLSGLALSLPARPGLVSAEHASIELVRGRPRRLALSGVRARFGGDPLGPGELLALRDEGQVRFRAATAGALLVGQADADTVAAALSLNRQVLGVALPGLDLHDTRASGQVQLSLSGGDAPLAEALPRQQGRLSVNGQVQLAGLAVQNSLLSAATLSHIDLVLDGGFDVEAGAGGLLLRLSPLSLESGAVRLELGGYLRLGGGAALAADLHAELAELDCAKLLLSLPPSLVPQLMGLGVTGRIAGGMRVRFEEAGLPDVDIGTTLRNGCKVVTDAPRADPRGALDAHLSIERPLSDGRLRRLPLGDKAEGADEIPGFQPLDALPWPVVRAFLVAEDNQFYQHHGFDTQMIARALGLDLQEGRISRGASTMTQQLVKNLWLRQERALGRKLEEAVLTWRLEQVVSKDRILEIYLNMVELGSGIYGIDMAAQHYFKVPAERLTLDQAVQLAALLPAPRRGMDEAFRKRYRDVLHRYYTAVVPHPDHPYRVPAGTRAPEPTF